VRLSISVARRFNFGKAEALASEREPLAAGVLIDYKYI
jgi:hypothetical protein